jgi:ketosteroid isomerase-like protein
VTTRDELAAFNEAFSIALAGQDVDRVVGFYTDDARLLFAGTPMIRGRAEIDAYFRAALRDGPTSTRFETIDILEAGSLVVEVGRYTTPTGTGKYIVVHERQPDGSLKMAVDSATGDGPRRTD